MTDNKVEQTKREKEDYQGPTRKRSCTDCFCTLIMLAFWGLNIYIIIAAFKNGNPNNLLTVLDYNGNQCGLLGSIVANYPYGYIYQPVNDLSKAVCVSACPQWATGAAPTHVDCYIDPNSSENLNNCDSSLDFSFNNVQTNLTNYSAQPFLIYNTKPQLNKICFINTDINDASSSWASSMTNATSAISLVNSYISDLKISWRYLVYVALIAFGIALLSMILIRYLAGIFVWLSILLFIGCFVALGVIALKDKNDLEAMSSTQLALNSSTYYNKTNLLIASIICFVVAGLAFIIMLFNISTIELSIAVIKSSALFIGQTFWIILVPIIIATLSLAYIIFWFVELAYLWSIGTMTKGNQTPFVSITWDKQNYFYVVVHFFAVLWNLAFLKYLSVFIIACSCVIWYYNQKGSPSYFSLPVLTSVWWSFRYHFGSISFAAFILALIWGVQLILSYIQARVKSLQKSGADTKIIQIFLSCLQCCMACFERVVQYISKLGLVEVAIKSKNFCMSCIDSMKLLMSNPMQFGLLTVFGSIFEFIGKVFITGASALIGYFLLKANTTLMTQINSSLFVVIVFGVIGYIVASLFYQIYGIASDAIILCFF